MTDAEREAWHARMAAAEKALLLLGALGNDKFVAEVRRLEVKNPDWRNYTVWDNGIQRELMLRLLLRVSERDP